MLQRQDGDHAVIVIGGARGTGLAELRALVSEGVRVACVGQGSGP